MKYKDALMGLFMDTSADNNRQPFEFNADLFPHVPDATIEQICQQKPRLFAKCQNYLVVALPALNISAIQGLPWNLMVLTITIWLFDVERRPTRGTCLRHSIHSAHGIFLFLNSCTIARQFA
jgi:hypothetical protein